MVLNGDLKSSCFLCELSAGLYGELPAYPAKDSKN